MQVTRYDRIQFKATVTDEGFLVDSPIVGRIGIQLYRDENGEIRRELRLPEEVFHPDSLATFSGKPITDGHPEEGFVDSRNAKKLTVGSVNSQGRQDANNVIVDIAIFDAEVIDKAIKGGKKELSLGYRADLEMISGEWEGQPYDAIQRNIRINHLAVVSRGRAGNAKLNLDTCFFDEKEGDIMPGSDDVKLVKVRLDSGLEYQAAPEVQVAFDKLKADNANLQKLFDTVTAERDTFKAEADKIPQIKADALETARKEVKARADLEAKVVPFKVDCAGRTDRQVKELAIKSVRTDADFTGKSDDYVDAAFDLAVSMRSDTAIEEQRKAGVTTDLDKTDESTGTYSNFMANLGKKEKA